MAEMLADCADEGVPPLVAGQMRLFLDAFPAAARIRVGIEFVEEPDETGTKGLALIANESQGLCQRSRSGQ